MTMNNRLSAFQYLDKFIDVNHINEGERCLLQNIVMMVLCDDIAGISLEGTVHELIVIRVGCDETKMVIHLHQYTTYNSPQRNFAKRNNMGYVAKAT